jgi:hypothetical protein
MFPNGSNWMVPETCWFELTLLSDEDRDQIVKQLNRFLRPEGHFATLVELDGCPCIAVHVRSQHPELTLLQLLRSNGIQGYFDALTSSPASAYAW